jgi:hypothetical protein
MSVPEAKGHVKEEDEGRGTQPHPPAPCSLSQTSLLHYSSEKKDYEKSLSPSIKMLKIQVAPLREIC